MVLRHVIEQGDFDSVGEMMEAVDDVIANGVYKDYGNNLVFTKDGQRVVVIKGNDGKWVLNAYDTTRSKAEKKRNEADASRLYQSIFKTADGNLVPQNPVFGGKDTNNPGNGQEKVAGDGWPDYPEAVRVELPPKLKRMLKEATGNRKKLLKEAIEDIGDNREALEMLEDDEPRTLEEVVSLLLRSGGRRPIRLLMDDVDDGSLKLKGATSYFLV